MVSGISFWRQRGFAFAVGLSTIVICAFVSFVVPDLIRGGHNPWIIPPDAWMTTNSAQYLSYGGIGGIYSANPWYSALPGFLVLFAPVTALGDHLGLVTSFPVTLARPSMWLVAGPFFFLCGATLVPAADYLAQTIGVSQTRRRLLALGIGLLVVVPTAEGVGHPEDLLALAATCVSLAYLLQKRVAGAALWLSAAVLLQTWAGLLIPVFVMASPIGLRARTLFRSAALPASVGALLLILDWKDASLDLLHQPMPGVGQHLPWWAVATHVRIHDPGYVASAVSGSSTRWVAVLIALVIGYAVRHRPTPDRIMLCASLALYGRALFETEFWPYYLAPAAVLFALSGAAAAGPSWKRFAVAAAGSVMLYLSAPMSYMHVEYPSGLALLVLLASGALCVASGSTVPGRPVTLRLAPALAQAG
jgi:hypothetical protein